MELKTNLLLEGLVFPESPRWHDDRLWFSDMYACQVMSITGDGKTEIEFAVDQQPSGLGWLPDGRMLVVSMHDRRLLRRDPQGLSVVAELGDMAHYHCNDMVVDRLGRAYIGNFGFDFLGKGQVKPTVLILVTPDGKKRVVAEDMLFPNGSVITADGNTLIVAESFGRRLTAFTIAPDGSLTGRRVWAQLQGASADGICLDAEGAVWAASPVSAEILRVREGGAITHRIAVATQGIACMLGGPDRQTLFVLSAPLVGPEAALAQRLGRIETVRVDVPGAGLP
ncbi:MAG: 5-valerolactone hydrolase [Rhodocyclaceae bacterium]|nr:MAG: 5-valerolactone hydrolase [Rhodocyclaceae bacterium]